MWIPQTDAAARLGVSVRTLRRWAAQGRIETRADQGRVLVDVPDEPDKLTAAASHLAESSKASAITADRLSGQLAAVTALAESGVRSWRRATVAAVVVLGGLLIAVSVAAYRSGVESARQEARQATLRAELDRIDSARIEAVRAAENASSENARFRAQIEAADRTLSVLGLTSEMIAEAGR